MSILQLHNAQKSPRLIYGGMVLFAWAVQDLNTSPKHRTFKTERESGNQIVPRHKFGCARHRTGKELVESLPKYCILGKLQNVFILTSKKCKHVLQKSEKSYVDLFQPGDLLFDVVCFRSQNEEIVR